MSAASASRPPPQASAGLRVSDELRHQFLAAQTGGTRALVFKLRVEDETIGFQSAVPASANPAADFLALSQQLLADTIGVWCVDPMAGVWHGGGAGPPKSIMPLPANNFSALLVSRLTLQEVGHRLLLARHHQTTAEDVVCEQPRGHPHPTWQSIFCRRVSRVRTHRFDLRRGVLVPQTGSQRGQVGGRETGGAGAVGVGVTSWTRNCRHGHRAVRVLGRGRRRVARLVVWDTGTRGSGPWLSNLCANIIWGHEHVKVLVSNGGSLRGLEARHGNQFFCRFCFA